MKIVTHYFLRPERENSLPYCYSNPTGEFETLEQACAVALAEIGAEELADAFDHDRAPRP